MAKQHNDEEEIYGPAMEVTAGHIASNKMIRPVDASCLLIQTVHLVLLTERKGARKRPFEGLRYCK